MTLGAARDLRAGRRPVRDWREDLTRRRELRDYAAKRHLDAGEAAAQGMLEKAEEFRWSGEICVPGE